MAPRILYLVDTSTVKRLVSLRHTANCPPISFAAPGAKMNAVTDHPNNAQYQSLSKLSGVTAILARLRSKDPLASESSDPGLLLLVNEEIKRLTSQAWVRSLGGQLKGTELVNEVWVKLLGEKNHSQPWASRDHFFNTVALAMQQVIVDHIRRNNAQKRTSNRQRAAIDPAEIPCKTSPKCIILVADALEQLESHNPNAACVVRLKYFGGYNQQEIM